MNRMHAPLDPHCPKVREWMTGLDDPIMDMSGCAGEFTDDFEKRHRKTCKRCHEYGAANIEVDE